MKILYHIIHNQSIENIKACSLLLGCGEIDTANSIFQSQFLLICLLIIARRSFISGTFILLFLRLLVVWRALVLLLLAFVDLGFVLILCLSFVLNLWVLAFLTKGEWLRHRSSLLVCASYSPKELVFFCPRALHKDLLLRLGSREQCLLNLSNLLVRIILNALKKFLIIIMILSRSLLGSTLDCSCCTNPTLLLIVLLFAHQACISHEHGTESFLPSRG